MKEDIKQILSSFLEQVETDNHSTNHFPSFYSGLKLKVGFGIGKTTKIPWITFLGDNQKPQNGIFPVYYFFKENHRLILAYGISESDIPERTWTISGTKTISEYYKSFGITPQKYGSSYVYAVYTTYKEFDWEKIKWDLDSLIQQYKKILQ